MKRNGFKLLSLVGLVLAILLSGTAAHAACKYGDVNCDGNKDVLDTQCVIQVVVMSLLGEVPSCVYPNDKPDEGGPEYTDLDCSGTHNIQDYYVSVWLTLEMPFPLSLDLDQNSKVDACETDCGMVEVACHSANCEIIITIQKSFAEPVELTQKGAVYFPAEFVYSSPSSITKEVFIEVSDGGKENLTATNLKTGTEYTIYDWWYTETNPVYYLVNTVEMGNQIQEDCDAEDSCLDIIWVYFQGQSYETSTLDKSFVDMGELSFHGLGGCDYTLDGFILTVDSHSDTFPPEVFKPIPSLFLVHGEETFQAFPTNCAFGTCEYLFSLDLDSVSGVLTFEVIGEVPDFPNSNMSYTPMWWADTTEATYLVSGESVQANHFSEYQKVGSTVTLVTPNLTVAENTTWKDYSVPETATDFVLWDGILDAVETASVVTLVEFAAGPENEIPLKEAFATAELWIHGELVGTAVPQADNTLAFSIPPTTIPIDAFSVCTVRIPSLKSSVPPGKLQLEMVGVTAQDSLGGNQVPVYGPFQSPAFPLEGMIVTVTD